MFPNVGGGERIGGKLPFPTIFAKAAFAFLLPPRPQLFSAQLMWNWWRNGEKKKTWRKECMHFWVKECRLLCMQKGRRRMDGRVNERDSRSGKKECFIKLQPVRAKKVSRECKPKLKMPPDSFYARNSLAVYPSLKREERKKGLFFVLPKQLTRW